MVPNSWKNQSPTSLFKLFSGFAFKSTDAQESGAKWLKIANVGIGEIKWDADSFLPEHFLLEHKKFALSKGDIVVALTRPTLGNKLKVARLTKESDTSLLNQRVAKIVCKEDADSEFVFQLLRSDEFAYRINVGLLGTDPPNLSVKVLEDFTVGCPPLPEQRKIAKILSTWDKAISTTEKLIETSKQQKKALMQQLLTGKKRLGVESGSYSFQKTRYGDIPQDWEYPSIREICTQFSQKNTDAIDLPVLSCSKHLGFVDSLKYFKKKVYSDDTSGYKVIPLNFFGFPSNHIEEGSIGLQRVYDKGIVSPIYVVFQSNQERVNNEYLFSLLKTEHYRQIFCAATNASVDRRGSLRWKEFSAIYVPLPPLKEQQKIATVLTVADKEIEVLEAKLTHFKQEKKALMQQLLTGKRRVKVDEVA
ncbi:MULTISPECIES: restriction endonuclease subunit S [Vibrio]|uniref:restriction endonuclease subunit S n=1 Tax=Vibrio TaxID=662 RepID=UPI0010BD5B24|nr:restriction endonuclease subunit S [Vibrio sp. F12]TKE80047.1 restriction endonuclease subunit S [Vibrio sp. F12]